MSVAGYALLGVEHIASGYDHLAFLLALLLIARSILEVASVVTGFTLAHSLTLALAVTGVLRPPAGAIEALIGLSIALVAAENLWLADAARSRTVPRAVVGALVSLCVAAAAGIGNVPALTLGGLALFAFCYFELLARSARPRRLRFAIAFVFGLLHGFGFAAALGEAGLPADRLVAALFGFNAGVEAGQLAVVAILWPILRLVTGGANGRYRTPVLELGSAAVLTAGVFWYVSRAFG
jgi:hypothetical protein